MPAASPGARGPGKKILHARVEGLGLIVSGFRFQGCLGSRVLGAGVAGFGVL